MGLRGVIAGMLALWLIAAVPWQADQDGQGLVLTNLGKAWIGTATVVRIEGAATGQFLGLSATGGFATVANLNSATSSAIIVQNGTANISGATFSGSLNASNLSAQQINSSGEIRAPRSVSAAPSSFAVSVTNDETMFAYGGYYIHSFIWPRFTNDEGATYYSASSNYVITDATGYNQDPTNFFVSWSAVPGAVGYWVTFSEDDDTDPNNGLAGPSAGHTNIAAPLDGTFLSHFSGTYSNPSPKTVTNRVRAYGFDTVVITNAFGGVTTVVEVAGRRL